MEEEDSIGSNPVFLDILNSTKQEATGSATQEGNPDVVALMGDLPSYDTGFEDVVSSHVRSPEDLTNRDYLTGYENPFQYDGQATSLEDIRSGRQSWGSKAGSGAVRITAKVAAEVIKIPGYAGGLVAGIVGEIADSEKNQFWETFVNNSWINAVEDANDYVNSELLPVYVKDSVKNGTLWENITSIDFWATEGADGIGYMAAMFVPGALINKFKFGEKLFKGVSNLTTLGGRVDEAAMTLGKLNITPNNVNIASTALANTMVEAAAEAKGAGDAYAQELQGEFEAGVIDYDEYQTKLKKKSEITRNVFAVNNAILLGPNLIMSKMMWGAKGASRPAGFMRKGMLTDTAINTETKLQSAGRHLGNFAKGAAREGGFEEGMQSAAEQYFMENPDNDYVDFIGGGFGEAYMDMLKTTEGQKAMFLGAILGGPMDVFMKHKEYKNEKEKVEKLVLALENLDSFYSLLSSDIYKKNGKIDNVKLTERLKNLKEISLLSEAFEEASANGETEVLEHLRTFATGQLITQFIKSGETGIDVLKEYLEQSNNVEEGSKLSTRPHKEFIKETLDRAKELQKDYNLFKQFAPVVMKLNNEKATKEYKEQYYDYQANNYINKKNLAYFYESLLEKVNGTKKDMLKSLGIETMLQSEDELLEKEVRKSLPLKNIDSKIKAYEAYLKNHQEILNKFWGTEHHKDEFDAFVDMKEDLRAKVDEARANEADNILKEIEEAESVEEAEEIEIPKTIANKEIKNALKVKIKELKKAGKEKRSEIKTKSEEAKEAEDKEALKNANILERLKENYNIGEKFVIPKSFKVNKKFKGAEVTITKIHSKGVTVKTESGSTVNLSLDDMSSTYSNTSTESTEGGSNTLQTSSKEPKKSTYFVERGDSKIISVDNDGNKLSFVSQEVVDFERAPRDKKGEKKSIEINKGSNKNKEKAIGEYNISEEEVTKGRQKGKIKKVTKTISHSTLEGNNIIEEEFFSFIGDKRVTLGGLTLTKKELISTYNLDRNSLKALEDFEDGDIITVRKIGLAPIESRFDSTIDIIVKGGKSTLSLDKNKHNSDSTSGLTKDQQKAVDMVDKEDFSDVPFLVNHLPMNVVLAEGVAAPMETLPRTDASKAVFDKSSRMLREAIVKELANGTKIEQIQVEIAGQFNGQLKVEKNPVPENTLLGLHGIGNDIKNINSKDFYIVNKHGALENAFGEEFLTRDTNKAPGEVYLIIKTANGTKFPLKLNVKKITDSQAEVLYELYKYRFEDKKIGKSVLIKKLPQDVQDSIKENFASELEWFKDNKKDMRSLTIKDLIDFVVWDGTKSPKSQIRFYNDLLVRGEKFTQEEFNGQEAKDLFKATLKEHKRHHVRFKRSAKRNDGIYSPNFENRSYVEYLVNNNILNTNAVINEPTFQGKTNMYLSNDIRVGGKKSKYNKKNNKKKVKFAKNEVIGTNEQLKKLLPKLFTNLVTLTKSEKFYKNDKGDKHHRASTLKGSKPDENNKFIINSNKRGNVIDEGMRYYFSTPGLTKVDFIKHAKEETKRQNSLKEETVMQMSDEFYSKTYDIFEAYYDFFEKKGWTIFSNTPSLKGVIKVSEKNPSGLYAGTMDLLAKDKNGKWFIIDLKTSTSDRALAYSDKKEDKHGYKKGDAVQQNTYSEMFEQSTNKVIEGIYILPIVAKPERNTEGALYDNIIMAKKNSMLLKVKVKNIFDLLKIEKPTAKQKEVKQSHEEFGKVDMAALLMGTEFEEKSAEEVKTVKTVEEVKSSLGLTEAQHNEMMAEFSKDDNFHGTDYKGERYFITLDSYYVMNNKTGAVITDINTILEVVRALQRADGEIFLEKNIRKVWKARLKVVPLQETSSATKKESKKDTKDTTKKVKKEKVKPTYKAGKISEEEASARIVKIVKNYKQFIKEISRINGKAKNSKQGLTEIVEFLMDNKISLENINIKCGF